MYTKQLHMNLRLSQYPHEVILQLISEHVTARIQVYNSGEKTKSKYDFPTLSTYYECMNMNEVHE